jgi:hypothetical protein
MALDDGLDRLSSLSLESEGIFRAVVQEQASQSDCGAEATVIASASGSWRACRKGVELVFEDADLPELCVMYSLRSGCLVAESWELPDGLVQEYSRCSRETSIAPERSMLIDRMLADASSMVTGDPIGRKDRSVVGESVSGFPCQTRDTALRRCDDSASDSEGSLRGIVPVGIIEERSDSDDEDWPPTAIVSGTGTEEKRPPLTEVNRPNAIGHAAIDEEYIDDFEGESDGSDDA